MMGNNLLNQRVAFANHHHDKTDGNTAASGSVILLPYKIGARHCALMYNTCILSRLFLFLAVIANNEYEVVLALSSLLSISEALCMFVYLHECRSLT